MLLGFVLGPLMEENLRRALLISRGDWSVFLTRPFSAVLMAIAAALLVLGRCCRRCARSATRCSSRMPKQVRSRLTPGPDLRRSRRGPKSVRPLGEMLKSKCRLGRAGICLRGSKDFNMNWYGRSLASSCLGCAYRTCIDDDAGAGAGLSDAQHHHDRAVRGRRSDRCHRAHRHRPYGADARSGHHHRERRRRRRHHRHHARGARRQ